MFQNPLRKYEHNTVPIKNNYIKAFLGNKKIPVININLGFPPKYIW